MRVIIIDKFILNISVEISGDKLAKAIKVLEMSIISILKIILILNQI